MHDLLEDTDYEIPDAVRQEYPDIDDALELLTKPSGMSYDEYCNQINVYASTSVGGQIAYWVKLADMKDHPKSKRNAYRTPERKISFRTGKIIVKI